MMGISEGHFHWLVFIPSWEQVCFTFPRILKLTLFKKFILCTIDCFFGYLLFRRFALLAMVVYFILIIVLCALFSFIFYIVLNFASAAFRAWAWYLNSFTSEVRKLPPVQAQSHNWLMAMTSDIRWHHCNVYIVQFAIAFPRHLFFYPLEAGYSFYHAWMEGRVNLQLTTLLLTKLKILYVIK